MARPINSETLVSAVDELRRENPRLRAVDVLAPHEQLLKKLRAENRSYLEIWTALKKAGLDCTYPNAVRAMKQILAGQVSPLEVARSRSRARRAELRRHPAVPVGLEPAEPAPRPLPESRPAIGGDPYRQAAVEQTAGVLVKTFGTPKNHTPKP